MCGHRPHQEIRKVGIVKGILSLNRIIKNVIWGVLLHPPLTNF